MISHAVLLKPINIEIVLVIVGLVFSLLAFIISIKAFKLDRKALQVDINHNNHSVKPILHPRFSSSTKKMKAEFYIENNGFGPLLFTKFKIKYKNNEYNHMFEVLKDIHKPNVDKSDCFITSSRTYSLRNYSMVAGKRKNIFRFEINPKIFKDINEARNYYKYLVDAINEIEFEYEFQDIYEQPVLGNNSFQYKDIYTIESED